MNLGKQFEQSIKASVPNDVFFYRLRDGTASWGDQENTRFQASNIADCLIYNGRLFLLELKSHKGKSLPLSAIRENQIKELTKASFFKGVVAGLIINFSDLGRSFFVHIIEVDNFVKYEPRKSIPLAWCEQHGIEIQGKKARTRYTWNLQKWISEIDADTMKLIEMGIK